MTFRNLTIFRGVSIFIAFVSVSHFAISQQSSWIATWAASPEAADPDPNEPLTNLDNQTVRGRLRVTLDGKQIRIRLSNECSSAPLLVGRVSVGVAQDPASVVPNSLRPVRFGKQD